MRQRTALLLTLATLAAPQMLEAADHNVAVGPGNAFSPADGQHQRRRPRHLDPPGRDPQRQLRHRPRSAMPLSSSWSTHTVTFGGPARSATTARRTARPDSTMFGTVIVTGGGGGTAGDLQFSTGSTSVNENAGTKTFTVTRTGGDDGPVSVELRNGRRQRDLPERLHPDQRHASTGPTTTTTTRPSPCRSSTTASRSPTSRSPSGS